VRHISSRGLLLIDAIEGLPGRPWRATGMALMTDRPDVLRRKPD
jgi:hypothetical protein